MTTVDSGIQCQAVSGPGTMSTPVIPSPYAGVFGLALGRKSLKAACTILSPPGVEFSHHVRWTFSKIHADLSEGPGPSAGVGLDVDGPQAPLPASAKPSPLTAPFPITCGAPPVPHHATQGVSVSMLPTLVMSHFPVPFACWERVQVSLLLMLRNH